MDSFYIIVLSIFAVFLILILTIVGTLLSSGNSSQLYPPVISQCPDYWDVSGNLCINNIDSKGISIVNGISNPLTVYNANPAIYADSSCNINPSNAVWLSNGLTPTCNQKNWANGLNIMWDGVSNYNSC